MRPRVLLLLLVVLACACTRELDRAVLAANAAHGFLSQANETLAASHRRARDVAIELAPTEAEARRAALQVHAAYRPVWDVYDAARLAWIATAAAVRAALAAEAAGAQPDEARVRAALASLAGAFAAFERAAEALRLASAVPRPGGSQAPPRRNP